MYRITQHSPSLVTNDRSNENNNQKNKKTIIVVLITL